MDSVSLLSALLTEERRLRSLAEEEVRAYRKTLTTLALRLAPAAFDARRRQDPASFERFGPGEWERFFDSVAEREERPTKGWGSEQRAKSHQLSAISGQQAEKHGHQPSAISKPGRTSRGNVHLSTPTTNRQPSIASHYLPIPTNQSLVADR